MPTLTPVDHDPFAVTTEPVDYDPFSADFMASRGGKGYIGQFTPSSRPPRPFSDDYPGQAPVDAAGRLTHDIEGRPLTARFVVGRNVVGGPEQALPAAEFNTVATETTGGPAEKVPQSRLGRDVGRTFVDRRSGQPTGIALSNSLTSKQAERIYGHELGHVIDEIVGNVTVTEEMKPELDKLWNDLNNPNEYQKELLGPEHLGYKGSDIQAEKIAEAFRAYMNNPNYIKTDAPNTAAAIREAANPHPRLSPHIQFNALTALHVASLPLNAMAALIRHPDDPLEGELQDHVDSLVRRGDNLPATPEVMNALMRLPPQT